MLFDSVQGEFTGIFPLKIAPQRSILYQAEFILWHGE
jgi:hypothetical protein